MSVCIETSGTIANLRVAITGSAGVGKTTLATMLSTRLGLPLIVEEMRRHLELRETSFEGRTPVERRHALEVMWRERFDSEQHLAAFVADNCCLDFSAYALFHGAFDDRGLTPEGITAHALVTEPPIQSAAYDAVFLLPWGSTPYHADGLRPDTPHAQLRYQAILEGLLARHLPASRVHFVPAHLTTPDDRASWVMEQLRERGHLAAHPVSSPARRTRGRVDLVGAGPGASGLLTLRALELIERADVVAYDKLVSPAILALCPPHAELLPVGHRGRGARDVGHRLHPLALDRARAGLRVVRLKAGDPLIFGRGGEEAQELTEESIPFEIVPGVSSALGAAAHAGIPLTHRDLSSDVSFITGHDLTSQRPGRVDWTSLASGRGTLVLYMASRRLEATLQRLIDVGRAPSTPAAYVADASRADQRVIVGTITSLADEVCDVDRAKPALVIVGDVVKLRPQVDWRSHLPLDGRRVLVARARTTASTLASSLRDLGADVIEAPQVAARPLLSDDDIRSAFTQAAPAPLLFTSIESVETTIHALPDEPTRAHEIWALGDDVNRHLTSACIAVDRTFKGSCRDALSSELPTGTSQRTVTLVSHDGGRPVLCRTLDELGWSSATIATYALERHWAHIDSTNIDVVVLPSSSTAHSLGSGPLRKLLTCTPTAAIGPSTASAAREHGATSVHVAADDSLAAVVDMVTRLTNKPRHEDLIT